MMDLNQLLATCQSHPWVAASLALLLYSAVKAYIVRWKSWVDVPALGPTGPLTSYLGAYRYFRHGDQVVQEGYDKYRGNGDIFKVADFSRWIVLVTSSEFIDEMKRAPDDVLGFSEAADELLQVEYTMGPNVAENQYHVPIIRSNFTRSLTALFPDIIDEVSSAFSDKIRPGGDEWVSLSVMNSVSQITARVANRTFVGLPLCRDQEFVEMGIRYTLDVVMGAEITRMFPVFLKGIVSRFVIPVAATTKRACEKLLPEIQSRYEAMDANGKHYEEKPVDFLSFLMDEATGVEKKPEELSRRILMMNFVSGSTTSISFSHVLIFIATMPQFVAPLREEVEAVIAEEGWTRAALGRCHKLDSFVKECMRLRGAGDLSSLRIALKDFTLSNGTFIPKGTFVQGIAAGRHKDPEVYGANATEFDAFRFEKMREAGEVTKHHAVSVGIDFLPFGIGKHACPGRFFAVLLMKTMLAYILINYDVKTATGTAPPPVYFNTSCLPNPSAEVMFRRRKKGSPVA
ncbi:cytochrome P450 [Sistotremastrum niveocremeum HHB9708]|uniref:Cytochrome P450 n=1 Tax=Sistotremastrum niveocremeum HHB9708 TaxID=1314777 RepID=A0A164XXJ2_9AGAM|nr:cytochrome P450 [Sistotremastrum niveocremeum HHB9708]